jgi:hypothetical protein
LDATHTNVGGSSVNATSINITKDLTNPNNAGSPAWVQASPSTTNTVTATWTKSNSGDLAGQSLQYYSDGTCTAASGAPVSAALASTQAFTGTSGTWSYKVISYDSAGNTNTSACSTAIVLKEASLAQSTLTLSPSSIVKGQISSLSLIIKDPSGVQNTLGGYTVTFSASAGAGVSTGTISATTDNGNGTYTATFTGTAKGTAVTITATITGLGAVTQTQNITVGNTAPVITPLATTTHPLNGSAPPIVQGNSVTLATAADLDSDTVTLSCTYQTLGLHASDPNYASPGTNCTNLDTITTAGSPAVTVKAKMTSNTSGALAWTPTLTQRGTYQFTINATDGIANATAQNTTVTIRSDYSIMNLVSALDSLNATNASGLSASTPSAPFTSAATAGSWLNLFSSASNGTLTFGTTNPWGGTGQSSLSSVDPYSLNFNQANSDSLSLGTVLNAATQFSTETWVKPSPLPSASPAPIIIGNGGGTGDGFVLRQSQTTPDRAEFVVGQKYYSYRDLILSDSPVGYWRFSETSGTTATDLSVTALDGTYEGNYTLGRNSSIFGDSDKSITLDGSTGAISTAAIDLGNRFTFETWIKVDVTATDTQTVFGNRSNSGSGDGFTIYVNNWNTTDRAVGISSGDGTIGSGVQTAANALSFGSWRHIAITVNRTSGTAQIYINGINKTGPGTLLTNFKTNASLFIGRRSNGFLYYKGGLDEMAIYNYELTSAQITEHYQTGLNGNYKPYPGNAVLADKPTTYWRLGEKTGGVAFDSSGNNYHGVNTSVVLDQAGATTTDSDKAAYFSGSGSIIDAGNITTFNDVRQLSLEAWVKTTAFVEWAKIIDKSGDLSNRFILGSAGSSFGGGSKDVWISFANGSTNHWAHTTGNVIKTGEWQHWVAVYNGYGAANADRVKFYINGFQQALTFGPSGAPTSLTTNSGSVKLGDLWNGTIDEVAIYKYALSPTQILTHYNSGNGPNWWICQSQTSMDNSNWNLLSTLYDGTTAKLFVNGQQECSVTPGTTYSGSVANTVVGSNPGRTSNFWTGLLSSLKIFGTGNGVAPATSTTIKTNFDSEANRYRSTPVQNIVTNGLVLHLDAANAKQGVAPFANGCTTSDLSWFNLASASVNGTLVGFTGCGASLGWTGLGTVASPFALTFNNSPYYAEFQNSSDIALTGDLTLEAWIYSTNSIGSAGIIGKTNSNIPGSYDWFIASGTPRLVLGNGGTHNNVYATSAIDANSWTHLSVTVSGNTVVHYKNSSTNGSGTYSITRVDSGKTLRIGNRDNLSIPFVGSMAAVRIYNRALSAQEIKQNCLAQELRFTNTPQSICAVP